MPCRYGLEVIESNELFATKVDFDVEHVDEQPLHIFVSRKWRDLQVVVRYVDEMAMLPPPIGLQILARHKGLRVEATRGTTREGGLCDLLGSDALFVVRHAHWNVGTCRLRDPYAWPASYPTASISSLTSVVFAPHPT